MNRLHFKEEKTQKRRVWISRDVDSITATNCEQCESAITSAMAELPADETYIRTTTIQILLFQVITIIGCHEKKTAKKKRLENLIDPDISDSQAVLLRGIFFNEETERGV